MATLIWADYLIFASCLAITLAIGLFHACTGGKQKTTQEFIMANRMLAVVPTMLSLLASNVSAITIVGYTAEMYDYGIGQWYLGVINTLLTTLLAERFIVPWMFPLKLTSSYEVRVKW